MGRKAGGLAAIMSGQPVVVKKKKSPVVMIKEFLRTSGLHFGLLAMCIVYIYVGALIFKHLEGHHEEAAKAATEKKYQTLVSKFLEDAEKLKDSVDGFGLVTPLTSAGRLFLCVYAIVGIPLALVTMSDIGKFFCDATFKLMKENMNLFVSSLVLLLILYTVAGGVAIHSLSNMTLFDSIYYCSITILTVGYGDIGPPIPVVYLILFIVIGVTLVTISVDVIAANAIHHVHYMGRQMGKAKEVAAKMIQMAQKISINRGLGLGMAQLGAFARMGMMINVGPNGTTSTRIADMSVGAESPPPPPHQRKSTAYDPPLDVDLIDRGNGSQFHYFLSENVGFGFCDDGDDDAFYR